MEAWREFQIFAKPVGPVCNLDCDYCYYLNKEELYPKGESFRMSDDVLEAYIVQQIEASPGPIINFSWHGGEPTLLGLDYFRGIVALQRRYTPPKRRITNGIQTNGTLLDDDWCRFFAAERFAVGLSLDGPQELHDAYRVTKGQQPTHTQVMRGYELLRQHEVQCDVLCVVHAGNVGFPRQVYRFFKQIKAQFLGFLPLVEPQPDAPSGVSARSVTPDAFGTFLCTIFDEWARRDTSRIMVQMFEEVARWAYGQPHALCIFRETCGDVPVVEHNGDFFTCDHFVDPTHRLGNIKQTPLIDLVASPAQMAFGQAKSAALPAYCRACKFLNMCNGGCPKDRIRDTPDGEPGLNYLCSGLKRFFAHCRPFFVKRGASWQQRRLERHIQPKQPTRTPVGAKTGRNDPCPCGSGLKYKKCCMGRSERPSNG